MGLRFYKSWKVAPGLRINLSKSGLSSTVGVRGLNTNLSKRGRRHTFGLPGSGLSYSWQRKWSPSRSHARGVSRIGLALLAAAGGLIFLVVLIAAT